jgi:hypothetical protein
MESAIGVIGVIVVVLRRRGGNDASAGNEMVA